MDHTADKALLRRRSAGQRFNGLKHGLRSTLSLLPDESPIGYGMLVGRVRRAFKPEGAEEKLLVKLLANSLWRLRRADRLEASLYSYSVSMEERGLQDKDDSAQDGQLRTLGRAFIRHSRTFLTLSRYRASIERPLFKALAALTTAQAARRGQVAPGSEILDISPGPDLYTPATARNGQEENNV